MVEIIWTDAAVDDFKQIVLHIQQDSKRYAELLRDRVSHALESLSLFPKMGRILPEFPKSIYREIFVLDFRIVYRAENLPKLFIISMTHAREDRPAIHPKLV